MEECKQTDLVGGFHLGGESAEVNAPANPDRALGQACLVPGRGHRHSKQEHDENRSAEEQTIAPES